MSHWVYGAWPVAICPVACLHSTQFNLQNKQVALIIKCFIYYVSLIPTKGDISAHLWYSLLQRAVLIQQTSTFCPHYLCCSHCLLSKVAALVAHMWSVHTWDRTHTLMGPLPCPGKKAHVRHSQTRDKHLLTLHEPHNSDSTINEEDHSYISLISNGDQ